MLALGSYGVERFFVKIMKVNEGLSVGPQPSLKDFKELRSLGFASVINNRPDGEEPGPSTGEEAAIKAEAAGLGYARQPVTLGAIMEADIRGFQQHLDRLNGPVFAHCKSGTRSLSLWALGEFLDGRLPSSGIVPLGEQFGVDLKVAAEWAKNSAQTKGGK